jgi:hypothetical protein
MPGWSMAGDDHRDAIAACPHEYYRAATGRILSGPVVFPATPSFLPPEVQVASQDLTRMDLAKWLVGATTR